MRKHTLLAGPLALTALAAGVMAPLAAPASAASPDGPAVRWHACPTYSDEVLQAMGTPEDELPAVRALLARMQCGSVSVPLDYRRPKGRQITVEITRLPARNPAKRLGSLALNPGGPGGSGYLMPIELQVTNPVDARLNERYDLIGFDPRGVGYSSKFDCAVPAGSQRPVGPLTKAQARAIFDAQVAALAACGDADPAFLGQLTTLNVARDLDRVRAGLRERHLNFLGVSWGTWLGAVYRNEFPARVGRMFLDSTAIPRFDLASFAAGRADAAEQDAERFAAWVAARNATYGVGHTPAEVQAAIVALRADFDASPRKFTDLPGPLDGSLIAQVAAQPAPGWPFAAQLLSELKDATGPEAPPTVKQALGGGDDEGPPTPPAGLPERSNRTMNKAAFCNEDTSRLGFEDAWATYQQLLARNPMTGRTVGFNAGCAGWPLPAQPVHLRKVKADVVLSGHRYESVSPYRWTTEMQRIAGGRVFTVEDDIHGSVLRDEACAADAVGYFETGRIDSGCAGVQLPADAAKAGAAPGTAPTTLAAAGTDTSVG
jgi:pimeloyl-ACP methyl ester carboxylesterase